MAQYKTSLLSLWKRGIQRGWTTVWRERAWVSSLGALVGVFLLLQLLVIVLMGVEGIQATLRSRTDLLLELQPEANDQATQEFISALQQEPYVDDVVYITKEQAYAQMKEQEPQLIAFLEEFNFANPFPETVAVTLSTLDNYEEFKTFVEGEEWRTVVDPTFLSSTTEQERHIFELLSVANLSRFLAVFFLVLTGGVLLFIVTELVRERVLHRAEEILVEHLSGAQAFSILLPFATEATILLFCALLISVIFVAVALVLLPWISPSLSAGTSLASLQEQLIPLFKTKLPFVLLLELLLAPALGWFGAGLGALPKIRARSLLLHQ